jgi:hypothetical protein
VSRLISPQAAFNRLRPYLKGDGWKTGTMLNDAVHGGDVELYRDGVLLNPTEIDDEELYVRVDMARNGKFTCTIASRLPQRVQILEVDDSHEVQMVRVAFPPPPKWEMDEDGVKTLRGHTRPVHLPEWRVQTEAEIQYLARIHSPLLENSGALYSHIETHLRELGLSWDPNPSRFHKAIDDLVKTYR